MEKFTTTGLDFTSLTVTNCNNFFMMEGPAIFKRFVVEWITCPFFIHVTEL